MQNAAADVDPATERGAWDNTASYLGRKLSRTKSGAIATKAVAEAVATADYDVLLLKLVSEPITVAQTISGTLNWVVGSRESGTAMNANWHVHVYVLRGTDTLVGTLYTNYTEAAGTNEWPTTAVGDTPTAALTLTPVDIAANDRIVIEAGYVARNTSTTSYTGTLWYGGTGGDLTVAGDETTLAGWWEFSQDLFVNNFLVEAAGGGNIGTQTAGTPFNIQITARDASNNTFTAFTGTVNITSTGTLSAGGGTTTAFNAGVLNPWSVTISNAGSFTITATAGSAGTSNAFPVNAGAFTKMQLLVPGETASAGSGSGKTGTPSGQTAGTAFMVTVNAVDANWNVVSSTNTVGITSSDASATLPANAALVAGTTTFSVTLNTAGSQTVTATNIDDVTKPANTSPSITVCGSVLDASYVAANAQTTQVIVYWSSANPVVILEKTSAFSTEAPANGTTYSVSATGGSLGTAVVRQVGSATSLTRTSLTNGTTYYYKVFANASACYSPGTQVIARPVALPIPAWSYNLAGGSILNGGITGQGAIYTSSNASRIISLNTLDGTQTPTWTLGPVATTLPIQGWLTWLPNSYAYRQPLTVTAGTPGAPSGYSVSVAFDHASLVSAGKSQASGNDVRVFYWNGIAWVQLDRVLDSGSTWNSASTKIWFTTQAAIAASGTDSNYYLYYGNPNAANPPANKANVFLFFDDFEDGTLNKWIRPLGGTWASTTTQHHSGSRSARHSTVNSISYDLVANPALNVDNVYVDAWWYISSSNPYDISQYLRLNGTECYTGSCYGADMYTVTTPGWDVFKNIAGIWTEESVPAGTPTSGQWRRVGTAMYGTTLRVFVDGTQINSATNLTELTSGNIGFTTWTIPSGSYWYIDDVIVRRYVRPEPTAAPGTEQAVTAGVVIGGDQSGTVYSVDTASGVILWQATLSGANQVQAPVAAQLRMWSQGGFLTGTCPVDGLPLDDLVFAASRNSDTASNEVVALRAATGSVCWTFKPSTSGSPSNMDMIVGMPWVDYTKNYVYVVSYANGTSFINNGAAAQYSVWVINSLTGASVAIFSWAGKLGDIAASPTMSVDGNTLYVVTTSGYLFALTMSSISVTKWNSPYYAALGSAVQGFIWENGDAPGTIYFATSNGYVWCLKDPGSAVPPSVTTPSCPGWSAVKTAVPGPSTPLPLGNPPDKLYVGSSDGKVHQLNLTTGVDEKQYCLNPPGSGSCTAMQVGAVSTETGNEIFVPTSDGTLYKLPVPLP